MEHDEPESVGPAGEPPQSITLRLTATAYHEAGHAVMALLLGRPIEKVTVSPKEMQTGGRRLGACKIQKGALKASQDVIEDGVLILLGGMVAESHLTDQYCRLGAAQDLMAARRLLANRATSERQLERLERRLLGKTEHLLGDERHTKAIQLIAAELLQKKTISGRAARHLFQQPGNSSPETELAASGGEKAATHICRATMPSRLADNT